MRKNIITVICTTAFLVIILSLINLYRTYTFLQNSLSGSAVSCPSVKSNLYKNSIYASLAYSFEQNQNTALKKLFLKYIYTDTKNVLLYAYLVNYSYNTSSPPDIYPYQMIFTLLMRNDITIDDLFCRFVATVHFSGVKNFSVASVYHYNKTLPQLTLNETVILSSLMYEKNRSVYTRNREIMQKCRYILNYLFEHEVISSEDHALSIEAFK